MTTKRKDGVDLSLLGKFVYFYPAEPTAQGLTAPLPNGDGTPHPGIIYNVYPEVETDNDTDTLVDVRVWAHGQAYAIEAVELWHDGDSGFPIAVFPEDDKDRKKANEDFEAKEAKAAVKLAAPSEPRKAKAKPRGKK